MSLGDRLRRSRGKLMVCQPDRRAETEDSEDVPFIMYTKGFAQQDGEKLNLAEIDLLD